MPYTTYLFDFDYTLADSSRGIVTCFQNVLNRHGYVDVSDATIKKTIGDTLENAFSHLTGVTDKDVLSQYRIEYGKEANIYMNPNTHLFPETITTLTELKRRGKRIGIISTKYRYRIESFLKEQALEDFFDLIIGGEDVEQAKPSPEGLILAMQRLEVSPEETVYIGDSLIDAQTAFAAKTHFIGVTTGVTTRRTFKKHHVKKIIKSLSELTDRKTFSERVSEWRQGIARFRDLKTANRFLRVKRKAGHKLAKVNTTPTTCLNCKNTFIGNYCNHCGQSRKTVRYNFRSIFQNILGGITNIDHGFGYTLLELLVRPGYMIKDYISGKRVRYFRPFQLLFILAAVYILLVQIIDPKALQKEKEQSSVEEIIEGISEAKKEISEASFKDQVATSTQAHPQASTQDSLKATPNKVIRDSVSSIVNKVMKGQKITPNDSSIKELQKQLSKKEKDKDKDKDKDKVSKSHLFESPFFKSLEELLTKWAHGNKAVTILMLIPVFAMATRISFRKRSSKVHFNMTEQLFIQAYIACLILLISILYLPFKGKADLSSMYEVPYWTIFLIFMYVHKQLYSITIWKSCRKTLEMFIYSLGAVILLATLLVLLFIAISFIDHLLAS